MLILKQGTDAGYSARSSDDIVKLFTSNPSTWLKINNDVIAIIRFEHYWVVFSESGIHTWLWNSLPDDIIHSNNLKRFYISTYT